MLRHDVPVRPGWTKLPETMVFIFISSMMKFTGMRAVPTVLHYSK